MKRTLLLILMLLCTHFVFGQPDNLVVRKPILYENNNGSLRSYFVEQFIAEKLSEKITPIDSCEVASMVHYSVDKRGNVTALVESPDENDEIHRAIADIITRFPRFRPALCKSGAKTEFADSVEFHMRYSKNEEKLVFKGETMTPPLLVDDYFHRVLEEYPDSTLNQLASYMGGDLMLFRDHVAKLLIYPKYQALKGISGRVTVSFTVNTDGYIDRDITVLSTPTTALADEVIRTLFNTKRWIPGVQNGELIRLKYTLPIDFKIAK